MNGIIVAAFAGGALMLASSALAQDAAPERVVITHEVIVTPRIVTAPPIAIASGNSGWSRAISGGAGGGGAGGAIGGYYINGTTPSDNRPFAGGAAMPSR